MTKNEKEADNAGSMGNFGRLLRGSWHSLRGQTRKQKSGVDMSYLRLCEQVRDKLPKFVAEEGELSFSDWEVYELAVWADAECLSLLQRLAEHPSTPLMILNQLASCSHGEVRASVADNVNTPLSIMWLLVKDRDDDVRYALAENHNLPSSVLYELSEDHNPYVASRAQRTIRRVVSSELSARQINGRGKSIKVSAPGGNAQMRVVLNDLINRTRRRLGLYLNITESR